MNQLPLTFPSLNAFCFFAFLQVVFIQIPGFEGNQFLWKIIPGGNASGVDFFFTQKYFLTTDASPFKATSTRSKYGWPFRINKQVFASGWYLV